MLDKRALWILLGILLLHVVLAATYATQTPYRTGGIVRINPSVEKDIGAPDERQHANYIQHLNEGRGFPVFEPGSPTLYETYQAHQPPAYYVLATGWAKVFGVSEVESRDNGLRVRSLNVLIGTCGVAGVFFLVFWGFGSIPAALAATAFAGLLPMNLALSGAISNDPLLLCLCTWVLALAVLGLKHEFTWQLCLHIGGLFGLALLTKTTAVGLAVPLFVCLIYSIKAKTWPRLLAGGAVALLIAGGWWIRNQQLYGDPLAMKAFSDAFTKSAQKSMFIEQIIPMQAPGQNPEPIYWMNWVGWWTARSFFGTFGYMDIWLTQSGRQSADPDQNRLYYILILSAVIGIGGWLYSLADKETRKVNLVLAVFLAVVVALFVKFNQQYFQAQGRYLLPAIGPISAIIAVGYAKLAGKRTAAPLLGIAVLLLVVNAFALVRMETQFNDRTQPVGANSTPVAPQEPGN